jgi:hypothetical protein
LAVTVVSLVLIVVAVVLLGYGLFDGSNTYLVGSILTSLVAALMLVVSSRRNGRAAVAAAVEAEEVARTRRRARQDELVGAGVATGTGSGSRYATDPDADRVVVEDEYDASGGTHQTAVLDVGRRGMPAQPAAPAYERRADERDDAADPHVNDSYGSDSYDEDDEDDDFEEPADEPPAQRVASVDAARVAQLDTEVLVIDGRPRYHLPGCVHLLGREHESLPVGEAVDLGFSPCGLCEPDSALLARARRG